MVAQYVGTGGPAKELAKIRYITQVIAALHCALRAIQTFDKSQQS